MLKYDINAISTIEDITGKSIVDIFSRQTELQKISIQRTLFWAGMLHSSPNLTFQEAGKIMFDQIKGGKSYAKIVEEISKAMVETGIFPEPEPEDEKGESGNEPGPAAA